MDRCPIHPKFVMAKNAEVSSIFQMWAMQEGARLELP